MEVERSSQLTSFVLFYLAAMLLGIALARGIVCVILRIHNSHWVHGCLGCNLGCNLGCSMIRCR